MEGFYRMKIRQLNFVALCLVFSPSFLFADGLNDTAIEIKQAKASFNYSNLEDAETQLKNLEAKYLRELVDAPPVKKKLEFKMLKNKTVIQPEPTVKIETEEVINIKKQKPAIKVMKKQEDSSTELVALRSEVGDLKQDLLRAETEVERLSAILEAYNQRELGITPTTVKKPAAVSAKKVSLAPAKKTKTADLPILKVTVEKANLRAGPSQKDSPMMTVAGGSRLVMEKRQGEWYRVIAPNGFRAWISSSVVESQTDFNAHSRTSTVKVKGYDQNAEARALRLLNSNF